VLIEHRGHATKAGDPDFQPVNAGDPPSYSALRTNHYLYVEYSTGQHEYYNLKTDPYELDNRYRQLPRRTQQSLRRALARMTHCHGSTDCWTSEATQPNK
jgi:N-acetylglucosamine-6-sulfatase